MDALSLGYATKPAQPGPEDQPQEKKKEDEPSEDELSTPWRACAWGRIDRLKEMLDKDAECGRRANEDGFYPLQWAALNNRVDTIAYLLDECGAALHQEDHTGQTALHWAAVTGSMEAAQCLLDRGASADHPDRKGYTPCHVCAQYGQTALLYYFHYRWKADTDRQDADGRTPLHWACYKGFADTARLLIVLECKMLNPDKEGCSPVHWAAIRGYGECITVLVHGGGPDMLKEKEVTGCTPYELAMAKGHVTVAKHVKAIQTRQQQAKHPLWGANGRLRWLAALHLCPVVWGMMLGLGLWFYHVVVADSAAYGPLGPAMTRWVQFAYVLLAASLALLYKTTTADPGVISPGIGEARPSKEDPELFEPNQYSFRGSPALWRGNWGQICVSCRIVKPLRSKHCAVRDRCIEVFDHYCPWVGTTVAKGNRHYFLAFLWTGLATMVLGAVLAGVRARSVVTGRARADHMGAHLGVVFFIVFDVLLMFSVGLLAMAQTNQVMHNVTTNELANWYRLPHFKDPRGRYRNPFDRGWRRNVWETFHPKTTPLEGVVLSPEREAVEAPLHACGDAGCRH
ncbi:unnamed protein product [Pedinophyceae sp. YPF-701]|nr:unnamed protein product [Pedinophyceae sp. YPF-701]